MRTRFFAGILSTLLDNSQKLLFADVGRGLCFLGIVEVGKWCGEGRVLDSGGRFLILQKEWIRKERNVEAGAMRGQDPQTVLRPDGLLGEFKKELPERHAPACRREDIPDCQRQLCEEILWERYLPRTDPKRDWSLVHRQRTLPLAQGNPTTVLIRRHAQ